MVAAVSLSSRVFITFNSIRAFEANRARRPCQTAKKSVRFKRDTAAYNKKEAPTETLNEPVLAQMGFAVSPLDQKCCT